jgi:hypothetical protein
MFKDLGIYSAATLSDIPIDVIPSVSGSVLFTNPSIADSQPVEQVHLKRLEELLELSDGWDGYEAPRPNKQAISQGRAALDLLCAAGYPPTDILPSAEGGVGLVFRIDNRYADIEIFNDGEIIGLCAEDGSDPITWEITGPHSLAPALSKVCSFVRRPPRWDVSKGTITEPNI